MKQNHISLIVIALLLITLGNMAFIISPKVDVNVATTMINTPAPPQYKALKTTFFERTMLKKISKKVNQQNEQIDLDKTTTSAQKLSRLFILSLLVVLLVAVLASLTEAVLFNVLGSIIIWFAIIVGIIAQVKANRVIRNTASTDVQKNIAKKVRHRGRTILIVFLALTTLAIIGIISVLITGF